MIVVKLGIQKTRPIFVLQIPDTLVLFAPLIQFKILISFFISEKKLYQLPTTCSPEKNILLELSKFYWGHFCCPCAAQLYKTFTDDRVCFNEIGADVVSLTKEGQKIVQVLGINHLSEKQSLHLFKA